MYFFEIVLDFLCFQILTFLLFYFFNFFFFLFTISGGSGSGGGGVVGTGGGGGGEDQPTQPTHNHSSTPITITSKVVPMPGRVRNKDLEITIHWTIL